MRTAATLILGLIALILTPALAALADATARAVAAILTTGPAGVTVVAATTTAVLLGLLWAALDGPAEPQT